MAGKNKSNKKMAVNFYSYSKLLFAWPLIVIGVLFYFIAGASPTDTMSEVLGWIYIFAALIVILTIGVDIERNYAFVWLVIFGLFFFLGRWLQDAQQITVFGNIYSFFANAEVRYNRGLGLSLSVLLAVPYAVMLLWARIQHKWRITYNEFEHYSWGRADDSLARGAKRVRSSYPDLLELLLAGAGTLVVYSATGRSELRRIRHVPLLPLLRWRINKILETTQVTTTSDQAYQRSIEEEEAAQEEEGPLSYDDEETGTRTDTTGLPGDQERL
jgi:hypothetical protein